MPIKEFKTNLKDSLSEPPRVLELENDTEPDHAAVSICFFPHSDGTLKFLMIRRALSEKDPWSGQMAFPGGKSEDGDKSLLNTALRETEEEIGVSLEKSEYLGQLSSLQGRRAGAKIPLIITPFVFWLNEEKTFNLDPEEVHSTHWIDVSHCLTARSHTDHSFRRNNFRINLPAIENHPVPIWGISYLMLKELFDRTLAQTNAEDLTRRLGGDFWINWRGY